MHGQRVTDSRIRPMLEQLEPRLLLDGTTFGPYQDLALSTWTPQSVYAADLDGDGDADVLSASYDDDKIAWYENLGGGSFSPQRVISTAANGATSVYAADLDGDGDADVLSASRRDDKIAWYENLGGGTFSAEKVISTAAEEAQSVYATDLDGDGDADVLSASAYDDKIAWYENLGGGSFSAEKVISTAARGANSVYATDLDGDGDADVLSASESDGKIAWYENLGGGSFSAQKVISTAGLEAQSVYATDLDGDGDADVLSASWGVFEEGRLAWYENLGSGSFSTQNVIYTPGSGGRSVYATDLDGDGDVDILSSGGHDVAWYENLGAGSFSARTVIGGGGRSVYATDLDGDGDADVLTAGGDKTVWSENLLELYDRYDLNRDGAVDSEDIDELYGHFAGVGQADLRYDLDGDRDADGDDVAVLVGDGLHTVFGDANVDGIVDGLDYLVWSTNYHQSGGWGDGDFTGDGIVDGLDYVAWSNNYEPVVPAAASTGMVGEATEQEVAATDAAQLPESELVGEAGGGAIPPSSVAPLGPGVVAGLGGGASRAAGAPSESDLSDGQEDGPAVPAWPVNRLRAIAPAGVPEEVEPAVLTDTGAAGMHSPASSLAALEDDLVDILGLVQLKAPLHA